MSGILGINPIIVQTKDGCIKIIPIKNLNLEHSKYNDLKVFSKKDWVEIRKIQREKTTKKVYRVSNCYNWLYATEDCKLLLAGNKTTQISEIKSDTPLYQIEYPQSNALDMPMPKNLEPVPHKISSIEDVISKEEQRNYKLIDHVNCKKIDAAKQAFLNERHNIQPNTTTVWTFVELQEKMILAEKVGFVPKITKSSSPFSIRFKSSYEDLKYDYLYLQPQYLKEYDPKNKNLKEIQKTTEYTYESYENEMKQLYSEKFTSNPLLRIGYALYDIPDDSILEKFKTSMEVYPQFLNESEQKWVQSIINWKKPFSPLFHYKKNYVYNIITDTGNFQVGVGKLIAIN